MEKDKIFFGEKGLTSTSANFIANQCKNLYQQIEKELDNIRFYNKYMSLIGTTGRELISEGAVSVSDINKKLDRVAQLKSLIAWLREAIKSKENLTREANMMNCDHFGLEYPIRPENPTYLKQEDVIGTWNIKQRNRYFYLETICAEIGKYIHPDGVFANERSRMFNILHNPRVVQGNGRDTIVYSYETSLTTQEVEDKYMELQNTYRGYQAELNSMKHEIETALENDRKEKDLQFKKDYEDYSHKMQELANQLKVLKNKALSDVQNLKIIIPDSLKSVYDEVSALGKK